MNKLKNKKGVIQIAVILIIIGIVALIGLTTGIFGAIKIGDIIKSIPTWFWFVLIGILFLILIPKGK